MSVYGLKCFEFAQQLDFPDYYSVFSGWHPIGFIVVTWLLVRLFNSWFILFASIQLLALLPSYTACKMMPGRNTWIGYALYLLLLFPFSLNGMKQAIAVGFGTLVIAWCMRGRTLLAYCFVFAALLFHPTGLVLAIIPIIFSLIRRLSAKTIKLRLLFAEIFSLPVIIALLFFVAGRAIIPIVAQLRPSFQFAVDHIGEGSISMSGLCLLLAGVQFAFADFSSILFPKLIKEADDRCNKKFFIIDRLALMFISIMGCLTFQFDLIALSLSRLAYYGIAAMCLWVPFSLAERRALSTHVKGCHFSKEDDKGRYYLSVSALIVLCIASIYFIYVYMINRVGEIVPFSLYSF